jgi:hypothetical protein
VAHVTAMVLEARSRTPLPGSGEERRR